MKKLFLTMAFAVIALSAAAQNDAVKNDHVTLKAGLGWATCYRNSSYYDSCDDVVSMFKVGLGFDHHYNRVVGMGYSLNLHVRYAGNYDEYYVGGTNNDDSEYLYDIVAPIHINLYPGKHWVLSSGLYCSISASQGFDSDVDFGYITSAQYQFNSGLFIGLDASLGFIPKRDDDNAGNCTASMFIGFAF
jgi:opacity protein-like surface antigen